MNKKISIERNKIGLEDILFGVGNEEQSRGGKEVRVTKVNARNLPFDETRNLGTALKEEKSAYFVSFGVNSGGYLIATGVKSGLFSINSNGELVIEYTGD